MRRTLVLALGALLACAAVAAPVVAPPSDSATFASNTAEYRKAYVAAVKAYRANRDDAFLAAAQRAAELRPAHAPARYLLAGALARNERRDEAIAALDSLAALGLSFHAAEEPAFASLKGDAGFAAVLARFEENLAPRGAAELVVEAKGLPGDFIPESIAWDAERERWLLGSVRQRRVAAVDANGAARDLVAPRAAGLFAAQGMAVRDGELWVANSALREMDGADARSIGQCALQAFSLGDGKPRGRWPLATGAVCALGDLLPLASPRVLTADSLGGGIYALNRKTGRYATVLAPGVLASPQGMAVLDWQRVAVADYESGLYALATDLGQPAPRGASMARTRRKPVAAPEPLTSAEPAALHGIDGLYAYKDSLIAIQNGTRPQRVLRLRLDADKRRVEHVEVLASNLPEWDEPTLGVIVGDAFFFVANSHWSKFDESGNLPPASELAPPRIMKIPLDR